MHRTSRSAHERSIVSLSPSWTGSGAARGSWRLGRGSRDNRRQLRAYLGAATTDYLAYLATNTKQVRRRLRVDLVPRRPRTDQLRALQAPHHAAPSAAIRLRFGPDQEARRDLAGPVPAPEGRPTRPRDGLKGTMAASGYGWLLPRIDWGQLTFRGRFDDSMAFNSSMLRDTYHKNGAAVKDAKGTLRGSKQPDDGCASIRPSRRQRSTSGTSYSS